MEKAEQHIQSENIRNVSILLNRNDIRNADMKELVAIALHIHERSTGMNTQGRGQ